VFCKFARQAINTHLAEGVTLACLSLFGGDFRRNPTELKLKSKSSEIRVLHWLKFTICGPELVVLGTEMLSLAIQGAISPSGQAARHFYGKRKSSCYLCPVGDPGKGITFGRK